jgi:hypothetical protein
MMMHRDEAPPPLAVKRTPKKVTALVMSALANNQRISTGAAAPVPRSTRHGTGASCAAR